ncbi:glycosyltransferase family 4 protein [Lutimonas zeaxanthinifaciens]|uniref:glycosyltransferase family 4 protein n=1 Tax=Lutimonas zeaxanthinifaciens TaxID=3060215 RepID=UPI00265C9F10|nr:glycosyltransferase family 4 protein [Lutimonas sp. YSD2104]WKK66467.1 glycosyltransferase family 4 protein [Lutimonas sp. YSD2104]
MNVLITAPSLNPAENVSGISTVVSTIIQNNANHNYYHYLLGRTDKHKSKLIILLQVVKQILLFPSFTRSNSIELVHQNLPFDPKGLMREYVINFLCRIHKIPVLLHVHGGVFLMNGTKNPFYNWLAKSIFKYSNEVVVLSELEKEAISTLYQYPSSKVLYNSIDSKEYQGISKKRLVKKTILLFLGRINKSKGIHDIVEALKQLKSNNISFEFHLCGAGPLQDYFVNECEEILEKDFKYLGIVSGEQKLKIIKNSNFFLLPSRYGEGLPMALLETMAAGVVPVVTDDASMKYVVHHEKNGIRVNKNDPNDLFLKLKNILSNNSLYQNLSDKAVQTIEEQFDIKNYVIQLNKIYNSTITQ